jgi:hypothetical protein
MNALLARYQDDLRRSHAELEASTRELKLSHFMIDHATDLVPCKPQTACWFMPTGPHRIAWGRTRRCAANCPATVFTRRPGAATYI